MIAESVPAADATVWTMLFSRIDEFLTALRIAIEITAAGIEEAKVRPTLRPRIDVRRGEDEREEDAQDEGARGEFFGCHGPPTYPRRGAGATFAA